jgi:hypothetical protein
MDNRIQPAQLLIYAAGNKGLERLAERFQKECASAFKVELVASAGEISGILNRYFNLSQINFLTHGNVATLDVGPDKVGPFRAAQVFKAPHKRPFLKERRVLFMGCQVAGGEDGREWLLAAGQALLRDHGGFVGGSTSPTFSLHGLVDVQLPRWLGAISDSFDWTLAAMSCQRSCPKAEIVAYDRGGKLD